MADSKTIYENSDQILALKSYFLYKSNEKSKYCLPQQYYPASHLRYYCFATDCHAIRPTLKPEVTITVHFRLKPVPDSYNRRLCWKKDGRYSMFEAEILNTF